MRKLQNTLYITTQGSYLHKEWETLVVEQERKKVAQLPVHSIGHIFCFGNVLVSPFLLGFCGENNVNLEFFTENGRYFGVFGLLLREKSGFSFDERNRRPPRDGVNALLSFVYSILGKDISGALQGVGLDPQVGFLHADRSGRDSLAQDILEEFRAWWVDRLVLSLINRGQIKPQDFVTEVSGAVSLKVDARKLLFQALQAKKQEKIVHPFLGEEVEIGLLPYISGDAVGAPFARRFGRISSVFDEIGLQAV